MDEVDRAQEIEQLERDRITRRHKACHRHSPIARIIFCVECGERIPERRQQAMPGTDRCAWCQSQRECMRP